MKVELREARDRRESERAVSLLMWVDAAEELGNNSCRSMQLKRWAIFVRHSLKFNLASQKRKYSGFILHVPPGQIRPAGCLAASVRHALLTILLTAKTYPVWVFV